MERMTRLEAVNSMLMNIRLAPVAAIDDLDTYHEGSLASMVLDEVTRDVLSPGWNFNTRRISLEPEVDGTIPVPPHTIDVFVPQGDTQVFIDSDNRLITFEGEKEFTTSVDCYVVIAPPWEQLPSPIQSYCMHRAGLQYKNKMRSGADAGTRSEEVEVMRAEARAKAWDLRQKRRSALESLQLNHHVNRNAPRW
jgi:hypothetical protein